MYFRGITLKSRNKNVYMINMIDNKVEKKNKELSKYRYKCEDNILEEAESKKEEE